MATRELAHSPWIGRGARIGLVAKGIAYILVATLAIRVAVLGAGRPEDPAGALETVADEPFGWALLVLLAVGLGGYAIWRIAQAVFDREREGQDPIGLGKRLAYFGDGLLNLGLMAVALAVLAGSDGGGSRGDQRAASTAFDLPGGRWLVAAVGVGIVAFGVGLAIWTCTGKFRDALREGMMKEAERRSYVVLGTFGHLARAMVVVLVGAFLVKAAAEHDPNEGIGLDGALRELAAAPYGAYVLGLVAFGLMAYGLFSFVEARYREV
jgi:Domain of Unknown Function (DUF1206)